MLPKGWKRSTLGDCTKLLSGNTPSKERQDYWSGEFPWVTVKDMKTPWLHRTGLTLTQAGKAAASVAPANSILVVTRGMALLKDLPISLAMRDVAFNQDIKAIVPNQGLDARFLAYQLQSKKHAVLDMVDTAGHGTGKLDTDLLKSVDLVMPPIPEQRRIAQILFTLDQAISTSEGLLANAQRQMAGLLQQLLIKPTSRGDWNTRPIGELSERIQRRANEGEELPVLMISSGSGFVRQDEKYSRFMAGKSVENYIALDRGEFAYNKGNSKSYEFGCVFPLNTCERGLVPNVYVCFKLSTDLNAVFYEHLFQADFLHDQLGALVNTGVRNNGLLNIKPVDFLACQVPVPPLDVQNRIAEVLTTASKWVASQERDLELLKQEKAALMSQLLTGERRVKLPDAKTEVQA